MPKRRALPNPVFSKSRFCMVCGGVFWVKPYNAHPPIYCGVPCCQRAYRERRKQRSEHRSAHVRK